MYRFDTLAIHAGHRDDETGAVCTPIYQTSTFRQAEPGVHRGGYGYSRTEHPTRRALEENLAALEGARYGLAFATGMAAIHNVLSILRAGDHVVSTQDLYGGAWRIFTKLFQKFGVDFTFVDACDLAAIERAIRPETKLLWLETPSNPLVRVTDIAACAAIAKRHRVLTVVDNTFATPVLQQPIALGADIVIHSTTKYINGHSDALGGAVITDDHALWTELKFFQNAVGSVPGPNDCFLIRRAIERGCDVVTANKALLAAEGRELFAAGRRRGVRIGFEASVCGGIPIVRALQRGLAGDSIESISAILNGTCNYVLTRMEDDGVDFAEALAEAQAKGFAEADPSLDVDGDDAAQKLRILAGVAFDVPVRSLRMHGIRDVTRAEVES